MRLRFLLTITLVLTMALGAVSAALTFYEAYLRGLRLEEAERWSEARRSFVVAARLRPEPGVRVKTYGLHFIPVYDPYAHMARCEFQLGFYFDARAHVRRSRAAGVTNEAELTAMEKRIQEGIRKFGNQPPPQQSQAEQTVPIEVAPETVPALQKPVLQIDSTPAGAKVQVDAKDQGTAPVIVQLESGTHVIECSLDGYQNSRDEVTLAAGERQTLSVSLAVNPLGSTPSEMQAAGDQTAAQPHPVASTSQAREEKGLTESQTSGEPEKNLRTRTVTAAGQSETSGQAQPRLGIRRVLLPSAALLVLLGLVFLLLRKKADAQGKGTAPKLEKPPSTASVRDTPTHYLGMEQSSAPSAGKQVATTPVPETMPSDLGAYRLEGMLGRGGMGTTYLGARKTDGLPVAIKIPHDHLLDSEEFTQRFIREASLGSTLHHPNIIRILETGHHRGKPHIVMELLVGETLEKRLRREGHFTVLPALELAREIALALDYARLKGVVHRDLKPENIMLLQSGGVKVMDFGLARIIGSPGLTATASYLGTPYYSAPEASGGEEVDQQSDLYSLGIILYRVLSGDLPFRSSNTLEVLQMHRSAPLPAYPPNLSIPAEVAALVSKLAAKLKADRYATAEAFLIDLNQLLARLIPT
jgi:hypothetical protein